MQYFDYTPGHAFGGGVFSPNGELRGDAVERSAPQEVDGAEGQNVKFSMSRVEGIEQLTEAITASAEVNGRYGLFHASASFDFAKSTQMSRYSLALLLSVEVTNSFRQLRDVELTPAARALWAKGRPDDFHRTYGDGYVHGMVTGGVYHAVLQIDTESEEDRRDISAELEAGYGGLMTNFNAHAQFGQSLSKVAQQHAIRVRHMQIGGVDSSVEITADDMIRRATEFPAGVAGDKAAPFQVLIKDYRTVSNLPPMPNEHDYRLAKDVINECGRLRLRYLDWLNDIDYVVQHSRQFVWTNEKQQTKQLDQHADAMREALTGLARHASKAVDDPANCSMPSDELTVAFTEEMLPDRKPRRRAKHLGKRRRAATPVRTNPKRVQPTTAHLNVAAVRVDRTP